MNKIEANEILARKIAELKTLPYEEFLNWQQRKHIEVNEIKSATGRYYQIEIKTVLEDVEKINGNIRVMVSINDSHVLSLNSYTPIARGFVISPKNLLVEE